MQINYTPVDSTFMTTGEIAPVKDTPMDFTTPKAVGKDIKVTCVYLNTRFVGIYFQCDSGFGRRQSGSYLRGEIAPVKDTPMDFTTPKAVGKDINNYDFVQLKNGNGYDHNWVLNTKGDISQVAARLTSPETGITLDLSRI